MYKAVAVNISFVIFSTFVLGVQIFVWVKELTGILAGDPRHYWMSHEFLTETITGFSLAAGSGGLLSVSSLMVERPGYQIISDTERRRAGAGAR